MVWCHLVSLLRKWMRPLMPCLVATIARKLPVVLKDLRHSRISKTGSVPGLLKDKEWLMVELPCKRKVKTPAIPQLSIPEAPNSPFLLMFSRKFKLNGQNLFPIWTVRVTKLSATLPSHVKRFQSMSSQLVSRWAISFSKWLQNNTFTSLMKASASSLSINVVFLARTRTFSSSVMLSFVISTQSMTLIEIKSVLVSTFIPTKRLPCTNQVNVQLTLQKLNCLKRM